MATEITEFVQPPSYQGNLVPIYQMPPLRHWKVDPATPITIGSDCKMALVQPAEDVRYRFTTDGTTPTADATDPIWKAGQRYDVFVKPGWKLDTVLA